MYVVESKKFTSGLMADGWSMTEELGLKEGSFQLWSKPGHPHVIAVKQEEEGLTIWKYTATSLDADQALALLGVAV